MAERAERVEQEEIFSQVLRAGRRTYFFDVRKTKGNDYYLTITESKKRFDGDGYERHKIFLYKEDFNRFLEGLNDTVEYVKKDLMPDYDYDEYTRRHEEYEAWRAAGEFDLPQSNTANTENATSPEVTPTEATPTETTSAVESEDDMSW